MNGHWRITAFLALFVGVLCAMSPAAAPKADFNGDGKADAAMAFRRTDRRAVERHGHADPADRWPTARSHQQPGGADRLRQRERRRPDRSPRNNISTGVAAVWLLDGDDGCCTAAYGSLDRVAGGAPVGIRDFNGDGPAHLLWRNVNSGELRIWMLNGAP